MMNGIERQEIARYRLEERIREAQREAILRDSRGHRDRKMRHRIAAALHRLADRVEPRRQPTLSATGR